MNRVLTLIVFLLAVTIAAVQAQSLKPYVHEESGYSIGVPDDWKTDTRISVSPDGKQKNNEFLVITGPGSGINRSNISVITGNSMGKTVDQYAMNLIYSYLKQFQKFELEEKGSITVNDVKFASFFVTYTVGETKYSMLTAFTIHRDKVFQINAVAPSGVYEKDNATVDKILQSFKIKK